MFGENLAEGSAGNAIVTVDFALRAMGKSIG
jgi:hypothetical protein